MFRHVSQYIYIYIYIVRHDFVIILYTVGTQFSAQAQNVWDTGPVNPVQ